MTGVDFFGHLFYAAIFFGMYRLAVKDYRGWLFRFAGEVGWIGIGVVLGMSSIVVWGFAFMLVDAWGFQTWALEAQAARELKEKKNVKAPVRKANKPQRPARRRVSSVQKVRSSKVSRRQISDPKGRV